MREWALCAAWAACAYYAYDKGDIFLVGWAFWGLGVRMGMNTSREAA